MKKSELLFYEIMNYPIPKNWEYFSTEKKEHINLVNENNFSWEIKNSLLEEYLNHIKKHQKLFQSLPWIKTIYLCNSITFNALHHWSDIDLFIVTKKWSLRRARLFSVIFFFFSWLKRTLTKTDKRFCLSFYITEDTENLYPISLSNTDIYLAYWLAHLVPLYQEKEEKSTIYEKNQRLYSLLPNLPKKDHPIYLWIEKIKGNTKTKILIEKYFSWVIWHFVEYMIKTLRIPILIYKTKKLKEIGKDIIFNNTMLKFYKDKRKKISLLYRARKTSFKAD